MFEDYKKFLKQNQQDVFQLVTVWGFALGLVFIGVGTLVTMINVDKFVRNSKQLSVYHENLATFQKCAEKVKDPSAIDSYCGNAPNEPVLTW